MRVNGARSTEYGPERVCGHAKTSVCLGKGRDRTTSIRKKEKERKEKEKEKGKEKREKRKDNGRK